MSTSSHQNTPLTLQQTVGLAACQWINLGIEVIPMECGEPIEDTRPSEAKMSQVATYNWFLGQSEDIHIAIKTGPSSELVAVQACTYDWNSGLHALVKKGFVCVCCDTIIRYEKLVKNQFEGGVNTLLFSCGKNSFLEANLDALPGISICGSGTIIPVPPWTIDWDKEKRVSYSTTYECGDTLAPPYITCMPDGLRQMIRTSERQFLRDKNKPTSRGGVLKELYKPVAEGGRDNALTRRAGGLMYHYKLTKDELIKQLEIINKRCCKPPLSFKEVRKIAHSVTKMHSLHG
jgi:hypothetical protein